MSGAGRLRVIMLLGGVGAGAWWAFHGGVDSESVPNASSSTPEHVALTPLDRENEAPQGNAAQYSLEANGSIALTLERACPDVPDAQRTWLAESYGNTAVNIAHEQGCAGLWALWHLRDEGLAVMRERPRTFQRISGHLGGEVAGTFLVWMRHNLLLLAEEGGLVRFLDRLKAMDERRRRLAMQYPEATPFLVVAPEAAARALEQQPGMCTAVFAATDISVGPDGLERVCDLITRYNKDAWPWVEARGLDGLLLLDTFHPFLQRTPPIDLPALLAMLSANQDDLAPLMAANESEVERVWDAVQKVVRADQALPLRPRDEGQDWSQAPFQGDWIDLACSDPHTLQLVIEHGGEVFEVLRETWPVAVEDGASVPSLLYEGYQASQQRLNLTAHAWGALRSERRPRTETFRTLLVMSQYPDTDYREYHKRSDRFRALLNRLDHRVVAYLGEAEFTDDVSKYDRLEDRGFYELDAYTAPPPPMLIQTIPGYDVFRLATVLARGHRPDYGEVLFAGVDVAFSVWDIATLGAGTGASTAARAGLKTAGKRTAREVLEGVAGKMVREGVEQAARRARVVESLASRLAATARVARKLKEQNLLWDLGTAVRLASKTASRLGVRLSKIPPKQLARVFVRDWTINLGAGVGLREAGERLAEVAEHADEPEGIGAMKAREAIRWLNTVGVFLEKPVGQ